jgi:metallo-beta-lactamase family protein
MTQENKLSSDAMKVNFYGAAGNVTGSSYVLECKNSKLLIDCGLYQERQFQDRNWNTFPFDARNITAVLLTHGHLDHCGLIPKLFKEGFKGKIYGTKATLQIAQIILNDSAKIQEEDANAKIKRHKKENRTTKHLPQPLYTKEDVDLAFKHTKVVTYQEIIQVSPDFHVQYINTGHIIGSAAIKITAINEKKMSILFSGDIGRYKKPILQDPENIPAVDFIVTESTYGGKEHKENNICDDLKQILLEGIGRGGKIVIPSFAIERAQELLYHIFCLIKNKEIPSTPVFIDSPMAAKAIDVFEENKDLYDKAMMDLFHKGLSPFRFKELEILETREDSKKLNGLKGAAIIIAGSGMCTGGRIKYHLAKNIQDPNSTVVFVGYQANGTLGRHILEGEKDIRILGAFYKVAAKITKLNGLSAHADRTEILTWLKTTPNAPKKIFITHGEENAKFRGHLLKNLYFFKIA